jgi:hypothetical protein
MDDLRNRPERSSGFASRAESAIWSIFGDWRSFWCRRAMTWRDRLAGLRSGFGLNLWTRGWLSLPGCQPGQFLFSA